MGRMSRRQRPISARPPLRLWLKVTGVLVALGVVAVVVVFVGFKSFVMTYLRSAEFRRVVEEKAGQDLRGRVEVFPVRFEGDQFFSDGVSALGGPDAGFHSVKVENVRGDFKLPSLWRLIFGDWRGIVDNVEVQRVDVDFDNLRTEMTVSPKGTHQHSEVLNIAVRDVRLRWRSGGLVNLAVKVTPRDTGWMLAGNGGRINQLGIPSAEVTSVRAMYNEPTFFLQELMVRQDGGEIVASGEMRQKERGDLQFVLKSVNVAPYLPDDWRARLHGRLSGDVKTGFSMKDGDESPAQVSGTLRLEGGSLEALPVLAKIAEFTKTDQFRRMRLDVVSGDFKREPRGYSVTKFLLESKQLLVVRGSFSVLDDVVDGSFEIGITPAPLQWLPGSQEKVFTRNDQGYAWTTLRVTGPTSAVQEDLSARLVDAAKDAAIKKGIDTAKGVLENGTEGALDAAKKGVSGAVDLLFGK